MSARGTEEMIDLTQLMVFAKGIDEQQVFLSVVVEPENHLLSVYGKLTSLAQFFILGFLR